VAFVLDNAEEEGSRQLHQECVHHRGDNSNLTLQRASSATAVTGLNHRSIGTTEHEHSQHSCSSTRCCAGGSRSPRCSPD